MPRIRVYIDETGDRGTKGNTSPIFGMAAVIVPDAAAPALRQAVDTLRSNFHVPEDKPLSWKEHVKTHDRRRRAAEILAGVDGIKVCYVYTRKADLRPDSYRNDSTRMYNWVAYRTYKSAVWAARNMGADHVDFRFGHVKGHDHTLTDSYIRAEAQADPRVPDHLVQSLRWVAAQTYGESQAADLFGGFLKAAVWPTGEFGYTEPSYLLSVWPSIRASEACAVPLGIFPMPDYRVLWDEPWFPCAECPKAAETKEQAT